MTFDLRCTMIDGKVCHVLTGQKASNRCNICVVGLKLVNDLSYVNNLPCNAENYNLGSLSYIVGFVLWNIYYNLHYYIFHTI